jgi:transposase InsO family protein
MWAHRQRQGVPVACCTIERLMREHGWRGATRTKKVRTTVADPTAARGTVKLTLIMIFLALVGARCGRHSSQIVDILWLLQQS